MIKGGREEGRIGVLVVEDEPLLLLAAVDLLTEAGFAAVGIGSADEALQMLRGSDQFSGIVTDIDLPGEANGFGVAWCAHNLGLAIIVVSGGMTPSPELLPPGSVFMAKPVDDNDLISTLRQSLHQIDGC